MIKAQCPYSVYPYLCDKPDCRGCTIMIENRAKANEDKQITEDALTFAIVTMKEREDD